jgi:transposase
MSSEEAVMQYAPIRVLPDVPPGGVCAGIDWAAASHAVCVVDMKGQAVDKLTVVHDRAGIAGLIAWLRGRGAGEAAIERGDGVLVDMLMAAGFTIVVITSRQVRNLRSRYVASGAKDDGFDAYVLADTLRTDRARLRPLAPDSPATAALRQAVRFRKELVRDRVRAARPAARPPAGGVPRRGWPVQRPGQPAVAGVPGRIPVPPGRRRPG